MFAARLGLVPRLQEARRVSSYGHDERHVALAGIGASANWRCRSAVFGSDARRASHTARP